MGQFVTLAEPACDPAKIAYAMRIVIPGGSGQVGRILARHFHSRHQVTVLARSPQPAPWKVLPWDALAGGSWQQVLDGADVVINLAGRSVNCRYTAEHRREIKQSRTHTTEAIGRAIAAARKPPPLWINASTATIYRHALDRPMDEHSGELGGGESGAPDTWRFSIDVAKSWEAAFFAAATPHTRKVALRSAMTMSPDHGGVFDMLLRLVRWGLGGTAGSGHQYVSWIHDVDFTRAVDFLIARHDFEGVVNLAAPEPVPNARFMRTLRKARGMPIGLPAASWMVEIGAWALRTETELVLKSRRVIPGKLLEGGFVFHFGHWEAAARDLVSRWRAGQ